MPRCHRRNFFRFVAASAVLTPAARSWAQQLATAHEPGLSLASIKDALAVTDFEAAARQVLPPAHWGYLAGGVDDDRTVLENVEAFGRIRLKPRRLIDVSKPDLATTIFGVPWQAPFFLCPIGSQRAFHREGELAVARAARAQSTTMMLSSSTSHTLEEVVSTLGSPPWYQLYMPVNWADTERLVKRIEDQGCLALVWTVDLPAGRNSESTTRAARRDTRNCPTCHTQGVGSRTNRPMFQGLSDPRYNPPNMTWAQLDRLRTLTRMKLLIKGLDTAEDARLAAEHGVDGIVVSNHGGRATETLRATIDVLPEIVDAVGTRVPVFVDGGIRRGSDAYKALALGARAVGIGRPYIWGLATFGQEGVERVIELLRDELQLIMRQMGTPTIGRITAAHVLRS